MSSENDKDKRELLKSLSLIGSIGWTMAMTIVLGTMLGLWLDNTYPDTKPLFLILGLIFGVAGGFWHTYSTINKYLDQIDKAAEEFKKDKK